MDNWRKDMDELAGSVVPLVTPMLSDGRIDFAALERLVAWHDQASTTALIVLGSTGEGTLLSMQERAALIDFVVEKSNIPTWVGVSAFDHHHAMQFITQAADFGADGVMICPPLYVFVTQNGLMDYFSKLADQSELEILLYNNKVRTGHDIDIESACILAEHDNIIGIKDCHITVEKMMLYQQIKSDFSVLCGHDADMLTCLSNGGDGVVSVIGNLLPELVQALCLLASKGIAHKALAIDIQWRSLIDCLSLLPNPTAIKFAMMKSGYIHYAVRSPLTILTPAEEAKLGAVLKSILPLLKLNPECAAQ